MNHRRHLIREAVTQLLADAGTLAEDRVIDHPTQSRRSFPALLVEDAGERQQASSLPGGPGRTVNRWLLLDVTAELQQSSSAARERDQLIADVERILATASIAGIKSISPAGYEPDGPTEGERPCIRGRQRFEVHYVTTAGDPATPL